MYFLSLQKNTVQGLKLKKDKNLFFIFRFEIQKRLAVWVHGFNSY